MRGWLLAAAAMSALAACSPPDVEVASMASTAPPAPAPAGSASLLQLRAAPCLADYARPYFGRLPRCPAQLRNDANFVDDIDREVGDRDLAALDLLDLGLELLADGEAETALRRFNQIFILLPKHFGAPLGFGAAAAQAGDVEAAGPHFADALQLAPRAHRQRVEEAIEAAQCLARAAPSCPRAYPMFAPSRAI